MPPRAPWRCESAIERFETEYARLMARPFNPSRPIGLSISVTEALYGRPPYAKFFVSSRMRGDPLVVERSAVISEIEKWFPFTKPWAWEQDATAGPYSSEAECVGQAATADGLMLILADTLTPITEKEFAAAKAAGAACFILLKDGVTRDPSTAKFVADERKSATTVRFRNESELRSHVTRSIALYAVRSMRMNNRRRAQKLRKRGTA